MMSRIRDALKRFWNNHKLKSFGALIAAFGAVENYFTQTSGELIPAKYRGLAMLVAGVIVAVLASLKRHDNPPP